MSETNPSADQHSGPIGTFNVLPESLTDDEFLAELDDGERLSVLERLEILDAPVERTFQVLTDLSNRILATPVSLISLVTDERQFFVSSSGLPEPFCSQRETKLSHSFCQFVVKRKKPLVICDAQKHPLVCDNLAIADLNVIAYLGVPLFLSDGTNLGSFCAIDVKPRQWTQSDLKTLNELAAIAIGELEVRQQSMAQREELEQRLRQAQKMEMIGNFTSGLAHDFNHALAAVQVNADLLSLNLARDSTALERIEKIQSTIASAKGVVGQLLSWSQPDQCEMETLLLSDVIEEAIPLLNALLPSSVNIVFENRCSADQRDGRESGNIYGSRGQLNQILMNLTSNAKDAMHDLGGQLTLAVAIEELTEAEAVKVDLPAGTFVSLGVTDEGSGIPKDILHRIHGPYFTTKPFGKGTGLGLWNVFGIAKSHKAGIRVESELNRGTTVTLFFPRATTDSQKLASETPTPPMNAEVEITNENTTLKPLRVLVIDDEPLLADGITEELEYHGHRVDRFLDGLAALEFFKSNPTAFDLVISDQLMPGIQGDTLIKKVKSINQNVRTIICSGMMEGVDQNKNDPHSPDAYLPKPFRLQELIGTINGVMSR